MISRAWCERLVRGRLPHGSDPVGEAIRPQRCEAGAPSNHADRNLRGDGGWRSAKAERGCAAPRSNAASRLRRDGPDGARRCPAEARHRRVPAGERRVATGRGGGALDDKAQTQSSDAQTEPPIPDSPSLRQTRIATQQDRAPHDASLRQEVGRAAFATKLWLTDAARFRFGDYHWEKRRRRMHDHDRRPGGQTANHGRCRRRTTVDPNIRS
jgi:hypothetical protein